MNSEEHARTLQELAQDTLDLEGRGEVGKLIASGRLGQAEKRVLQAVADRVRDGTIDLDSAHWRYRKLGVEPDDFIRRYYDK